MDLIYFYINEHIFISHHCNAALTPNTICVGRLCLEAWLVGGATTKCFWPDCYRERCLCASHLRCMEDPTLSKFRDLNSGRNTQMALLPDRRAAPDAQIAPQGL